MKNHISRLLQAVAVSTLGVLWMSNAFAFGSILTDFRNAYPLSTTDDANCAVCHTSATSAPGFNPYGQALANASVNFVAIEGQNSDGDAGGFTNLQEITANTQPGWCAGSGCANPPSNMPAGVVLDPPSAPSNTPPVVNAGGTYNGVVGVAVSFSNATASDADNDTLTYLWSFGDGGSSNVLNPTHTYASAGQRTATLTVNDGTVSVSSSATVTIGAANNVPTANAGGPYGGEAGTPVSFSGSGFDADGDTLTYAWNFGDGSTGTGASPTHTYGTAGTYDVSLTVNDGKANSAPSSATATITTPPVNAAPTANAGGPYSGQPGQTIAFNGSGSSDPNGDVLTYAWNFGDGASGTGVSISHAYAADGTYTATLTVTDTGSLSDAASATVTIATPPANQAPVADAGGPYTGNTGASITLNGTGSSDPEGLALTYAWDFGDGSSGTGARPAHSYAAAGTYDLGLTVSDGELSSDPSFTTVTVTDPAEAIGGEALYAENCAGCHGDPWTKPAYDESLYGVRRMAGARECIITASIYGTSVFPNGVPEMQYLQGMFSEQDVADLATYLNSRDATGEQRYVTACAGCHGADGSGGRSDENVMGEDADETSEAIRDESDMRFLACMPQMDIKAIGSFLTDAEGDNDHDGIGDDDDDDDDNDGIKDEDDDDDDGDELSDDEEGDHGSNPSNHDSDNDDLDDGEEVHEHHTDPMDDDSDDDGLTDGEEVNEYGTDPNDDDSDDDGYSDGDEIKLMGTDPLVANSATTASNNNGGGGALGWILLLGMLAGRFFPLALRKQQG